MFGIWLVRYFPQKAFNNDCFGKYFLVPTYFVLFVLTSFDIVSETVLKTCLVISILKKNIFQLTPTPKFLKKFTGKYGIP